MWTLTLESVGTAAAPKNLRTAPQSSDQTFTGVNAALQVRRICVQEYTAREADVTSASQRSSETLKPIRVIRGFKAHSCFGERHSNRYLAKPCS